MRNFIDIVEDRMVDEISTFSANSWDGRVSVQTSDPTTKRGMKFFCKLTDGFALYIHDVSDKEKQFYVYKEDTYKPIGYFTMVKFGEINGWHISGALYEAFWGKGLGLLVYKALLDRGITLISGDEQTVGSQKVWKALMDDDNVITTVHINRSSDDQDHTIKDPWSDKNCVIVARKSFGKEPSDAFKPLKESEMVDEIHRDTWKPDVRNEIDNIKSIGKLDIYGVVGEYVLSSIKDRGYWYFIISNKEGKCFGYLKLQRNIHIENGWFIESGLYPEYTRIGIGYKVYKYLLHSGLTLVSGLQQTKGSEMLWKKLMKQSDVVVTACSDYDFEPVNIEHEDDIWNSEFNIVLVAKAGSRELKESEMVAILPDAKPPYNRCTFVSTNAILAHFKKPIMKSGRVPMGAEESFEMLSSHGLRVLPDKTFADRHMTVKTFVETHPKGAWYIGTKGHAMAVCNGVLTDTENKGLDSRLILICAAVVR